jgi:hypothetical protein
MTGRRRDGARRIGAVALFAIACALSPSMRELVDGHPVSAPAPMALLSFCLAIIALALVVRSAIGDRRGDGGGIARPSPPARAASGRDRAPFKGD